MNNPHIYVIHLKDRTDRKKQFLRAWVPTPPNLHWFPAVLGAALPDSTLATFRIVAKTRKARAGRVGCYCSHVAAIETAIQQDHFPLLILEDDALPTKSLQDLTTLFETAPEAANLLYFGALPVAGKRRATGYCRALGPGWHTPPAEVALYGGHAYGFRTREAAQDVLAHLKSNKITYDSALLRYQKKYRDKVSVHCPFQFYQAEGYSDIENTKRAKRGKSLKKSETLKRQRT
jgi:GR25 family glycosyltransferase involved in LPS biosynthesis